MADLHKRGDSRKDWLRWAVELLKRGVWAGDEITVHGPHRSHATLMWGEAEVWFDGEHYGGTVTFRTVSGISGIYDVRRVRVANKDTGEALPILPAAELSPRARRWLRVAQRLSRELIEKAKGEAAEQRSARQRSLRAQRDGE